MSATIRVHLRVVDAMTKQPTPVRISIVDPMGNWWMPFGRFVDFPIGRAEGVGGQLRTEKIPRSFYIDGACEIELPSGEPLAFTIRKGSTYQVIQERVIVKPGQLTLRMEMQPVVDFRAREWISGDSRVQFVDPHTVLLEAAAEDLSVAQLLLSVVDTPSQDGQMYRSVPYLSAFSGTEACLENDGHLVAVNTLNNHPVLGRVGLLNAHRPIFPLNFGDMDETDDWSICDWCDQCHRKTGLVTWCDPFLEERGLLGGETLIAAIVGKIDAFEVTNHPRTRSILAWYYPLLNAGVRIPLVGGSGKDSNRIAIGEMRTWIRRGEGPLLQNWIEAVRRGEACVSTGIPIELTANGLPPGSVLRMSDSHQPIRIRSVVHSFRWPQQQLVVNGKAISMDAVDREVTLPEGGWLCTRAIGEDGQLCHSSPIYVEVPDKPRFVVPASVHIFLKLIESTREWIRTVGRFEREKSREHLLDLADQAESVLKQRLEPVGG